MWRSVLREYFAFPKKERKGIFVLLIIWLILIVYQLFSSENLSKSNWKYFVLKDIENMQVDLSANTSAPIKFIPKTKYIDESNFKEFQALGLSIKTSAIITKFIKKDVDVRQFSTIKKIFSITEEELEIIKSNYLFEKNIEKKSIEKFDHKIKNDKEQYIDINRADTLEIEALNGIGWKLSKRIFVYREKLGGFIRKEQLMEVYGIDSMLYEKIEDKISLDTNAIRKLNINTCSLEELSNFPYIGWKLGRIIFNYRKQHGDFSSSRDLLKIKVLNSEQVQKIEPYLIF